jgi:hypothetical protein
VGHGLRKGGIDKFLLDEFELAERLMLDDADLFFFGNS